MYKHSFEFVNLEVTDDFIKISFTNVGWKKSGWRIELYIGMGNEEYRQWSLQIPWEFVQWTVNKDMRQSCKDIVCEYNFVKLEMLKQFIMVKKII